MITCGNKRVWPATICLFHFQVQWQEIIFGLSLRVVRELNVKNRIFLVIAELYLLYFNAPFNKQIFCRMAP